MDHREAGLFNIFRVKNSSVVGWKVDQLLLDRLRNLLSIVRTSIWIALQCLANEVATSRESGSGLLHHDGVHIRQ